MKTGKRNRLGRLLGPVLALLALAVYGATLSRHAYPGQSAGLIVQYSGLFPLMSPSLPLWGAVFRAIWMLPVGDAIIRVNALSAILGAVGIWLLYRTVSTGVLRLVNPSYLSEQRAVVLARISGVVAGLSLCFSIPYWVVATRAHNATFDVALFLTAVSILMAYVRARSPLWLYVLAFIWGIGTVEYATFIIFAPAVFVLVLLLMWQKGQLRALPVVTALSCGLLGLCLYLVAAWHFYGTPGYEIREYPSYFKVVWYTWRDQYRLIVSSLPREGWLIIILTTGAPWLAGLGAARRGINDDPEWTDLALHLVLSLVCGMVLLNLGVAPWTILGHTRILVMPYVLTAVLSGYLAVYWLRQGLGWGTSSPPGTRRTAVRALSALMFLALSGIVVAAPFRNYASARTGHAGAIQKCTDALLDIADEKGDSRDDVWVISDGSIDDQLRIAAASRPGRIHIINLHGGRADSYLMHIASFFDSPRMKNLARVGILPLLQELFSGDESIRDRAVVFGAPDLWHLAGYISVANRLCFKGSPAIGDVELPGLLDEHKVFWKEVVPELQAAAEMADDTDPAGAIARHLLRHCSLVANNLGVLLEDDGLTHEAFTTYLQSRTIFPENVSAALNMARMIDAGYESDLAQDIRAHLEALKEQASSHQNMLALSVSYGYVREPETFSGIARTWALTGQPRMAALSLEKALDVLDPKQHGTIKADLAGLYLDQSRDEESAALFYEALAEDPTERRAIMGLARIAARKGQFDEAEAFLVQAASAGVPADALSMERAVIAVLRSDFAQAREISERLVREDESRILAWRLLADLLARSQNWAELKRVSDRLSMSELGRPLAAEIRALLSLRNADVASARRFYAEVLAAQPANVNVRSQAMRLELVSADLKAAQSLARPILEIDGDHGLANYVIGAARLASGEYELAEEALRRCVARERLPQALNDLSWLLLQKKAYAEAESLAREATDLQPTMYQAWDTLGEILLRQGKLTEAEVALEKVLSLTQENVDAFLHMAQLQAAKGDKEHARKILRMIADRADRLSSEAKAEYDALQRTLDDG